MGITVQVSEDRSIITVTIPGCLKKHGGRKRMIMPDGAPVNADRNRSHDETLLKNLVNAHRWQRMIDSEQYPSISQLCEGEGMTQGNISTVMRMVTLAPDIQEAILYSTHPAHLTRAHFKANFPICWKEQREHFGFPEKN